MHVVACGRAAGSLNVVGANYNPDQLIVPLMKTGKPILLSSGGAGLTSSPPQHHHPPAQNRTRSYGTGSHNKGNRKRTTPSELSKVRLSGLLWEQSEAGWYMDIEQ